MLSVTPEQFDKCCEITAESAKSLSTICKEVGCTYKAMRCYIDQNDETRAKYACAKEDQADYLAEEILEIADDKSSDEDITDSGRVVANHEFINRSRLKVDARKWVAAHLKPKKYSDKLDLTSGGDKLQQPPSDLNVVIRNPGSK